MVNSVDLLVCGPGFAEHSFCEVSRYPLSAAQIMQISVLYIDVPAWTAVLGEDLAVN